MSEFFKAVMAFSWVKVFCILVIVGAVSLLQLSNTLNNFTWSQQVSTFTSLGCSDLINSTDDGFECDTSANIAPSFNLQDKEISSLPWQSVHSGIASQDFLASVLDNSPFAKGEKLTLDDKKDLLYVPTYNARYISVAQHDTEQTRPLYLLAFEFISPPVPSLTIGYEVNFSPQLDWVLSTASPPSRLSAWKDSNLLYSDPHLSQQA